MRKQLEFHVTVNLQFNVSGLSFSNVFNRTCNLIGFQTVKNQWGGCSQSDHTIKVSMTETLNQQLISVLQYVKHVFTQWFLTLAHVKHPILTFVSSLCSVV